MPKPSASATASRSGDESTTSTSAAPYCRANSAVSSPRHGSVRRLPADHHRQCQDPGPHEVRAALHRRRARDPWARRTRRARIESSAHDDSFAQCIGRRPLRYPDVSATVESIPHRRRAACRHRSDRHVAELRHGVLIDRRRGIKSPEIGVPRRFASFSVPGTCISSRRYALAGSTQHDPTTVHRAIADRHVAGRSMTMARTRRPSRHEPDRSLE